MENKKIRKTTVVIRTILFSLLLSAMTLHPAFALDWEPLGQYRATDGDIENWPSWVLSLSPARGDENPSFLYDAYAMDGDGDGNPGLSCQLLLVPENGKDNAVIGNTPYSAIRFSVLPQGQGFRIEKITFLDHTIKPMHTVTYNENRHILQGNPKNNAKTDENKTSPIWILLEKYKSR